MKANGYLIPDLIASLLDCSSTYSTVDLVTNQVVLEIKFPNNKNTGYGFFENHR